MEMQQVSSTSDEKTNSLRGLRALFARHYGCPVATRDIVCTPCGGYYGQVAYWTVVLEGSPPKGAIIVGHSDDVFYILGVKSRRLGTREIDVVKAFAAAYLKSVEGRSSYLKDAAVVTVPGEPAVPRRRL